MRSSVVLVVAFFLFMFGVVFWGLLVDTTPNTSTPPTWVQNLPPSPSAPKSSRDRDIAAALVILGVFGCCLVLILKPWWGSRRGRRHKSWDHASLVRWVASAWERRREPWLREERRRQREQAARARADELLPETLRYVFALNKNTDRTTAFVLQAPKMPKEPPEEPVARMPDGTPKRGFEVIREGDHTQS